MTDDEYARAAEAMKRWHARYAVLPAPLFTLWASERIRRDFGVGLLSWDFVMAPLGLSGNRQLGVDLTVSGLGFWQRPLRQRSGDGTRLFLYSLMSEGGLPDAFLARSSGYAAVLQAVIGDYEREALGPGDPALVPIAARRSDGLPAALQNTDSNRLLAELAMAFVRVRRDLPPAIGVDAAEAWLDRNRPGWAQTLPLRLSEQARRAILMPALMRQPGANAGGDLAWRLLLLDRDGDTWVGAVEIAAGGVVPFALLPQADRAHVLRLATADGRMLRASPEQGGWRLDSTQPLRLRLDPWAPTVLTAHSDGRILGEVVVDAGLPEPSEAPGLWRARAAGAPDVLVPANGGRTRGGQLWVLAPEAPEVGEGVVLHPPRPGPGGMLWPVSGKGEVRLGERSVTVATGAEDDDPPARLLILAQPLREAWPAGGMSAYVGRPRFLGAEGDLPLKDVTDRVRIVPSRKVLGLHRFDWVEDGRLLVSTRAVFLPEALKLRLREKAGGLVLETTGLPPDWRLAVLDGSRHLVPTGQAVFETPPAARGQGEVGIELFDREGRTLVLRRPWPTREPMLIEDTGHRMTADRQCSLPRLMGWRGVLPDRGALQVRMPAAPRPVAFEQAGTVRLAAWRPLLAQALALSGADGVVNLRMVNDSQTPRLRLARYDWVPERQGAVYDLGPEPVRLRASTVQAPVQRREIVAQGLFDPHSWLGDTPDVWLVQGWAERAGVMRPFPFAVGGPAVATRDQRIATYRAFLGEMLADPGHPGWAELTAVLQAARDGGDCGGLDQAQALGTMPAVAVALLFRAPPAEVAALLDLETEAPFWWPAVPLTDWQRGLVAGLAATRAILETAGFDAQAVASFAAQAVARSAGAILSQRPELAVHLGRAVAAVGLPPVAVWPDGEVRPLGMGDPEARLRKAAMQMAARGPSAPQGTGYLKPRRLPLPAGFSATLDPMLAAPLVTAEAVLGERALAPADILELLALRHADPVWFDTALPCALAVA